MYDHKSGISLRRVEDNHLYDLLLLKQESWWGTHTFPLINEESQKNWLASTSDLPLILEKEFAGKPAPVPGWFPVGVTIISSVDWLSRTAKISGSIFKDYRQDLLIKACCATGIDFAFEILNLWRLDAEVLETNYMAQKYEIDYLGFKVEGKRRQAVYKSGKYYDSLVIGLLRSEWVEQTRVKAYDGSCNMNFDHSLAAKLVERSRCVFGY